MYPQLHWKLNHDSIRSPRHCFHRRFCSIPALQRHCDHQPGFRCLAIQPLSKRLLCGHQCSDRTSRRALFHLLPGLPFSKQSSSREPSHLLLFFLQFADCTSYLEQIELTEVESGAQLLQSTARYCKDKVPTVVRSKRNSIKLRAHISLPHSWSPLPQFNIVWSAVNGSAVTDTLSLHLLNNYISRLCPQTTVANP